MEDNELLIGRKHQELQALAYFTKKKIPFEYDTADIPELIANYIRFRPDFIFRGDLNVIVEVDENFHSGYDPTKECKRMIDIWNAFNKNMVFIRIGIEGDKELSSKILKIAYEKILSYQKTLLTQNKLIVDHVNYPSSKLYKYSNLGSMCHFISLSPKSDNNFDGSLSTTSDDNSDTISDNDNSQDSLLTPVPRYSFLCRRCGYSASKSRRLISHLKRKKPCIPKDSESNFHRSDLLGKVVPTPYDKHFICTYCTKSYTTKAILKRHLKGCSNANKLITMTKQDLESMFKQMKMS